MQRLMLAGLALCACGSAVGEALISPAEIAALRAARPGDRVALATVPRSRALLDSAVLKRIEIYAPDAKIYVMGDDGPHEVPRSTELQFISVSGPTMALSVAADGRSAHGTLLGGPGQNYRIKGTAAPNGLTLDTDGFTDEAPDGSALRFNVDAPDDVLVPPPADKRYGALDELLASAKVVDVAARQAVVAIDTDNEFMQLKFADNATNATNYIASLFTNMNVIYERDLNLTLVQGMTFLRPSTTPDPYSSTSSTATDVQLDEFSEYWRVNNASVACAFALILSGKSSSNNSSAGIAWLLQNRNYCAATGQQFSGHTFGHFALDRVFKFAGSSAASDTLVAAHELGHNFGAAHTHCTDITSGANSVATNTIDQCFTGEGACCGCYTGSQVCPASHTVNGVTNVTGTLMSYCHLSGISGCSSALVFADIQRTVLTGYIQNFNVPTCITATSSANQAPSISAPASIAVAEDTLSSVTGITFGDSDAGGGSETATFTVATGALSASAGGGVTVGGTSSALTLAGTITNLNMFVMAGNLKYTTALNAAGSATLNIQINDNGNTGTGGALTGNGSSSLTITAVNDAPTISAPASIGVTEDQASALTGFSFADVDAGANPVVATLGVAAGSLAAGSCSGVAVGGSATSRTLTGTIANLNSCIVAGAITYTGAANATGTIAMTLAVNDQGNTGSGGALGANTSTNLNIAAVNDAPTVTAPASIAATAPGVTALNGIVVADIDGASGSEALTLTVSQGTLLAVSGGGVTASGAGTATLTLTGTIAALDAFLATPSQVSFVAATGLPGGTATLTLSINDNGNTGGGGAKSGNASTVLDADIVFRNDFE